MLGCAVAGPHRCQAAPGPDVRVKPAARAARAAHEAALATQAAKAADGVPVTQEVQRSQQGRQSYLRRSRRPRRPQRPLSRRGQPTGRADPARQRLTEAEQAARAHRLRRPRRLQTPGGCVGHPGSSAGRARCVARLRGLLSELPGLRHTGCKGHSGSAGSSGGKNHSGGSACCAAGLGPVTAMRLRNWASSSQVLRSDLACWLHDACQAHA